MVCAARFPWKFSNTSLNCLPDSMADFRYSGVSVDADEARRLGSRKLIVGFADPIVEGRAFVVDARFGVADTVLAAAGAKNAGFDIDLDEHSEVRFQTAAGDSVEVED